MTSEIEPQELENASGKALPQLTELEGLTADLRPYLARQLTTMNSDLMRTLVAESGVSRTRIQALADATKLEEETGLHAAIFYGLARQDIPLNRETLFTRESEELSTSLEAASTDGIIFCLTSGAKGVACNGKANF